ncbi:MAG: alpha-keto acid decarboxylase family protein [Cellulomonadaceae bacterium]|nr:alpha-keto acid decarboxylase family protein [Cellulomonadaceae bacterium]
MTDTLETYAVEALPRLTVPVHEYLGRRLMQVGVEHLFGVPGDFNLTLLDGLATLDGLTWVGSPNELGAGYAADAYARVRGLAALVTTYGVGELSALNAVAGSAAESAPVLHIAGSPSTRAVAAGALVHHTLADGDFGRFERAYAEVTVAQHTLTAERAAEQIDAVILAALTHRKPVYLSIPSDLADAPVDAEGLEVPLRVRSAAADVDNFEAQVRGLLADAQRPVVVVGHLVARFGLGRVALGLARGLGCPLVTLPSAKGAVDESEPHHAGVYAGTLIDARTAALVRDADVVLNLGTVMSDVLSGLFTHRPHDARTVQVDPVSAQVGEAAPVGVLFADALRALVRAARDGGVGSREIAARPAAAPVAVDADAPLTQVALWHTVQEWLPAHGALLADTGTSFWGAMSMHLPDDTVVVTQPIWNSIGYALPATLGQGLADPTRRPVLLIGDGAAQMTAQELSTLAATGVRPVVILVNNAGYTIERAIQSPTAAYNDVPAWDWALLVRALCGDAAQTHRATTAGELVTALGAAAEARESLVLVEVMLDKFDAPPLLQALAAGS